MGTLTHDLKVEFDITSKIVEKKPRYLTIEGVCYHSPLKQRKCHVRLTQRNWLGLLKKNWKKVNVTRVELLDSIKAKGKMSLPLFRAISFEKHSYRNLIYTDEG